MKRSVVILLMNFCTSFIADLVDFDVAIELWYSNDYQFCVLFGIVERFPFANYELKNDENIIIRNKNYFQKKLDSRQDIFKIGFRFAKGCDIWIHNIRFYNIVFEAIYLRLLNKNIPFKNNFKNFDFFLGIHSKWFVIGIKGTYLENDSFNIGIKFGMRLQLSLGMDVSYSISAMYKRNFANIKVNNVNPLSECAIQKEKINFNTRICDIIKKIEYFYLLDIDFLKNIEKNRDILEIMKEDLFFNDIYNGYFSLNKENISNNLIDWSNLTRCSLNTIYKTKIKDLNNLLEEKQNDYDIQNETQQSINQIKLIKSMYEKYQQLNKYIVSEKIKNEKEYTESSWPRSIKYSISLYFHKEKQKKDEPSSYVVNKNEILQAVQKLQNDDCNNESFEFLKEYLRQIEYIN